jgi:hypothetical protein
MNNTSTSRDGNIVKLVFRGQDETSPILEGSGSVAFREQLLAPVFQGFRQAVRGCRSLLLQKREQFSFRKRVPERFPEIFIAR